MFNSAVFRSPKASNLHGEGPPEVCTYLEGKFCVSTCVPERDWGFTRSSGHIVLY